MVVNLGLREDWPLAVVDDLRQYPPAFIRAKHTAKVAVSVELGVRAGVSRANTGERLEELL